MEVETSETEVTTVTEIPKKVTETRREGGSSKTREEILADQLDEQISKSSKYRQANSDLKARLAEMEPQAQRGAEAEESMSKLKLSHRQELAMARLEALAVKDGIVDPDALNLIDQSKLKFDKEGKPSNLADVLKEFRETKPHFFGAASSSSTAKVPSPAKPDPTSHSDADYAAFKKKFNLP